MNPDFVDLLRAFAAADVRFLIVGAYALAHHGRPRATGDLDVFAAFGAPLLAVTEQDFARPGIVFQIGIPPGWIDIVTKLTGVLLAEAWPDRDSGRFGDLTVDFIGREAFLRNKRAAGRAKDMADIEGL